FRADENTTGAIRRARDRDKEVGGLRTRLCRLPSDMIQTEVELVECQRLLEILDSCTCWVLIAVLVVHLQDVRGKHADERASIAAKIGFSKLTSTPTMSNTIVLLLCASRGEEIVSLAAESR